MQSRFKIGERISGFFLFLCLSINILHGQEGDRKDRAGTIQKEVWKQFKVPSAPVLSPEKALESFTLPRGFRVELVASEPLVEDPVEIEFDDLGRLWAVEMRGYMRDVEGNNEADPIGRIVVLEDLDDDGQMDKSTVFLDQLIMPRAIAVLSKGVLVAEPPNLWFCKDLDGDLKCDERTLLDMNYASQSAPDLGKKANPEHASNGLLWAIDNWIYSANHRTRFRFLGGEFVSEPSSFGGQWGISQDNFGRLFYNSNSDHFRGDLIPFHYLSRNQNLSLKGVNVRINPDQSVWPSRVTTGVNRGYRKGVLRDDGTLTRFTGACGTLIYRGSNFPKEFVGDAFICEPTANFIRRNKVSERDGIILASNAYHESEFLTSSDERFRPVNMINGPDGCLYVVDFYRGLIQHRLYLTTFLRRQIEERRLHEPAGLGRIYRVVFEKNKGDRSNFQKRINTNWKNTNWVSELSHPDAWRRDTAQRMIVEMQDLSFVPALKKMAIRTDHPLGQIHALWCLHGLQKVDKGVIQKALLSPHPKVRSAALRVSESLLKRLQPDQLLRLWETSINDVPEVQMQLALSLGEISEKASLDFLKIILERNLHNEYIVNAVLSSVGNRELELLESLLNAEGVFAKSRGGGEGGLSQILSQVLSQLSAAIFRTYEVDSILLLLELAAKNSSNSKVQKDEWKAEAMLKGIDEAAFKKVQGERRLSGKPIFLKAEPEALKLLINENSSLRSIAQSLLEAFIWPEKEVAKAEVIEALTKDQQALFEAGRDLYLISCGACHQPHGGGMEGIAPPLLDSDWVLGKPERLTQIALHGLQGPIEIRGKKWDSMMPGMAVFEDDQLASVLTYVRREWGHVASPISPEFVASVREKYIGKNDMWTVAELQKVEKVEQKKR